jgi:serine/threonine-protein kinase
LKPQNLFFDAQTRQWKVLDFGISKLGGAGTLTAGMVIGTPGYMAPEQAAGRDVDHRADLFSLGAIAYRCLTGRPAFISSDPMGRFVEVMTRHPPSPSSLGAHPDFDAALALALAKSPDDRVGTPEELAQAIADAAEGRLTDALRARGARLVWGSTVALPDGLAQ